MADHLIKLMLDSGAFSAWTRRKVIDLNQYIEYLQQNGDLLHHYVNLDVIPGVRGRLPDPSQIEAAAKAGWSNYRRMVKAGLKPIPVYHVGERRYWLERMIGEGASYIGLGGLVGTPTSVRRQWLDEVFTYLCGPGGYPPVKVHGFGLTTISLVHRYPWTTTDSTSWVMGSKTGICMIPYKRGEQFDFAHRPITIRFGSPSKGSNMGQINVDVGTHYLGLGEGIKRYVDEYLATEGFDPKRAMTNYRTRCRINIRYFKYSQAVHPNAPYQPRTSGFFAPTAGEGVGRSECTGHPYRLIFANVPTRHFCLSLKKEKAYRQLLSYLDLMNRPRVDLEEYIQTGAFPKKLTSLKG